jgi:hypothetical protein
MSPAAPSPGTHILPGNLGPTFLSGVLAANAEDHLHEPSCPLVQVLAYNPKPRYQGPLWGAGSQR